MCEAIIATLSDRYPKKRFEVAARRVRYVHGRVSGHDKIIGAQRAEMNRLSLEAFAMSLDIRIGLASILDLSDQFWTVISLSQGVSAPTIGWSDPVVVPDLFLKGSQKHPSIGAWPEHFDLRAFLTNGHMTDRGAISLALSRAMEGEGSNKHYFYS